MLATVVILLAVVMAFVVVAHTRPSNAPLSPIFMRVWIGILVIQAVLLAVHFVTFRMADVTVVTVAKEVPEGHKLTTTDLATKKVDRASADGSVRTRKDAEGLVTAKAISKGGQVTTTNARGLTQLVLPGAVFEPPWDAKSVPDGLVDVFAAPRRAGDAPVIIEGALVDLDADGRAVLHLTKEDRETLLAILARSIITIEQSED